ncbi:MAG: BRCT domain-containing protein [Bacilli bacterium]
MGKDRIEELRCEIARHNALYNSGNSEISDEHYDKLVEELRALAEDEPILGVINPLDAFGEKITHRKPMLSLDKVYSYDEMKKWMFKTARNQDEVFLVMPKYDGISGKYEGGILSTRGDGYEGTILNHALPLIDFGGTFDSGIHYGELVITNSDFETVFPKVIRKDGSYFKNSRNAVAGIVGNEDVEYYKRQNVVIRFMEYRSSAKELSLKEFDELFPKYVEEFQKIDVPIDGIVVRIKDDEYAESLGVTGHHPKHSMAFKFANQVVQTKLIGYEVGMGKDSLSLVGLLEPVECSGVTISRVVLPLTRAMDGTGKAAIEGEIAVGDIIHVKRAGEVIPYAVSIEDGTEREIIKIEKCPFCGSELKITRSSVSCTNDNCDEKLLSRLYSGVVTLGMKGIGRKTVQSIMKYVGIKELYGFMTLTEEQLKKVPSFGDKTRDNVLSEISKAKNVKIEVFLDSLNLPSLGTQNSKLLSEKYNKEEILSGAITYDSLMSNSFGPITSENVSRALKENKDYINALISLFTIREEVKVVSLNGEICFTGKMSRPRSELESLALSKGFSPKDDVSKTLSVLVVADKNSTSSKMKKAAKFGVKIITEDEFMLLS